MCVRIVLHTIFLISKIQLSIVVDIVGAYGAPTWHVDRAQFDNILLDHASELGASVYQEHKVVSVKFHAEDTTRPISAEYQNGHAERGTIEFDYLIDASGRQGIMSTRYLRNRQMSDKLKNIACWGYWLGGKRYAEGTHRENSIFVEGLSDKSGWAWYIPVSETTFSVGFVIGKDANQKKRSNTAGGLSDYYLSQLQFAPQVKGLLADAVLNGDETKPSVQSASDYSYTALSFAGPFFRLAGDASGRLP